MSATATRFSRFACGIILAAVAFFPARADDDKPGPAAPGSAAVASPAQKVATFELQILGPDGKPVPDAKVELRSTPVIQAEHVRVGKYQRRTRYGASITSDANGRVVFDRPADWRHLDLMMEIPGFAPYWAGWDFDRNSEPIPANLTAKLDGGWLVGGVVVDDGGKPIVGAQIWPFIEFAKRAGETRQLCVGTHLRTDSDGRWIYENAPASINEVSVEISKHDFMSLRTKLARSRFGVERGHRPAAKIALNPGLIVTGKVTDEAGKPIEGAVVRTKFVNDLHKTVTGADGTYRLRGAEPGEARIVASAHGRAIEMKQVAIGPDTKVDFIMQPGRTIRVRVLDEKGHPIPRARIFFQAWRGRFEYFEFDSVSQYADKQGVWEWNEAPLDMFAADICRPDGMQLSRQPLIARKEEYVFRVPPALVVSGKVVDAKTRQPISKFRVVPGTRALQKPSWYTSDGFTSIDGRYRVRETYGGPVYLFRIEAEGYWPAVSREIKNDEGNVSLDFELTRGKDVEGTVFAPDGTPAAEAKVALATMGSEVWIVNGEIDEAKTAGAGLQHTDSSGHFHFGPQTTDFVLIITHPSGYIHAECSLPSPKFFNLSPWAHLEGTYRVAHKLQPNADVCINHLAHQPFGANVPHFLMKYRQTTDANGRFVFDRVIPGQGWVGRKLRWTMGQGYTEVNSSCMVPARFKPGRTTHIDVGPSGRPVIGQLRRRPTGSKERAGWNYFLVEASVDHPKLDGDNLFFSASVDRNGNFCFDDMPPGDYVLNVAAEKLGEGRLERHRFNVPEVNEKLSQRPVDLGVLTLQSPETPNP